VLSTIILGIDFEENFNFLLMVYVYAIVLGGIGLYLSNRSADSRKLWLGLSVIVNLGLLGVFKYFNFFAESLTDLASTVGVELSYSTLAIVLPVGISFYTFQTMSYTIDVYRKKLEPSHKLIEVSAYIAFFPQLVAGPIERGAHLLPQFFEKRKIDIAALRTGAYLFLWGMFKKAVIADNLAAISDPVFQNPQAFTSGELLVALLAFTFQIYCDFSGYSDMARGIARMMGFNLMVNFNVPYVSLAMGMLFFTFVVFTWLLFRAQDFTVFSEFLTRLLSFNDMSGPWLTLIGFIIPLWLHDAYQAWKDRGEFVHSLPSFVRLNVVLAIVCCIIFLQPSTDVAFLYFDF